MGSLQGQSNIHGGPGKYGHNRPSRYNSHGSSHGRPVVRQYPDRLNVPKDVTTSETVEHMRWMPVFEQHPAFQADAMDLYLGKENKMSNQDIAQMLELAGLDISACESRVDLLALLTTSIETSLPKDGSTRDAQSFSHRANRNSNASGTRYATGDGSANNRRKPGRKKDPEGKTRVVTCDLAAVMHGYFIGGMESAKHRTSTNVPRYHVDLDAPPEDRWHRIIDDFAYAIPAAAATMAKAIKAQGEVPPHFTDFFMSSSQYAGEVSREISAVATQLSMSPADVITMQLAYETLAGCKEQKDRDGNPTGNWDNFSDSTIVAPSKEGPPLMLKSTDWDCRALNSLVIEVDFQRDGKSVFIATTWAGYLGCHAGMRPGGFGVAVNRRPGCETSTTNGTSWPVGFLARNVLENEVGFGDAVTAFTSAPLNNPCYITVCGTETGEGVTISRFEDRADRFVALGDPEENTKKAHLRNNPRGSAYAYEVLGATVEYANVLIQTNAESGAVFAQRNLLELVRKEIAARAQNGEHIHHMSKEQLISMYLPPVTQDMQHELLISALLSSLEGGGTYTLEELWAVANTEACRSRNTLYQVSMVPRVCEFTTKGRATGGHHSHGQHGHGSQGVGLGDGMHSSSAMMDRRYGAQSTIRYPEDFSVANTGIDRFRIAFEAVDQWHNERTYHNMHVQYLLQESGDADCCGVTLEDIASRHYLQAVQGKVKASASNPSKIAIDSTDGSGAYRPSASTVAAGGGRKLIISETLAGKDLTVTELANARVRDNHKATLAALRGQALNHRAIGGDVGRGTTWAVLKQSRMPNSGDEHADHQVQEPRWPLTQTREENQDAAGREQQMRHARNGSPRRKYRFGGEVEPRELPNKEHRLAKNWKRAPCHGTHKYGSFSHAINEDASGYAAPIAIRTGSPLTVRHPKPVEREEVPALQEGRHADDGLRAYEKTLLTLCYHGKVAIFKGGEHGAAVAAADIANHYRMSDGDFIDYGGMVAERQAGAIFGSDPFSSFDMFPVVASSLETMRPHSGHRSDLPYRQGSVVAQGYGQHDSHYRQTLPYQHLASGGAHGGHHRGSGMDPHPHNAGNTTSSYQYHAPVEHIQEPPQGIPYYEEEPVRGQLVRQYSGPAPAADQYGGMSGMGMSQGMGGGMRGQSQQGYQSPQQAAY